jgi:hypothetical protein
MDTSSLFPNASSTYTDSNGIVHNVPCFIPGEAPDAGEIKCPYPFVNPLADDHLASCIQPCPVQAYTDEEYTWMWGISNGIAIVGFSMNVFMVSWEGGGGLTPTHVSILSFAISR